MGRKKKVVDLEEYKRELKSESEEKRRSCRKKQAN